MKRYVYPAIFEQDEQSLINITFPNILGISTSGKNFDEAFFNAKILLESSLNSKNLNISNPFSLKEAQKNFPNKTIVMIDIEI